MWRYAGIRTLLLFGADITVVAREVPEEQRQGDGRISGDGKSPSGPEMS